MEKTNKQTTNITERINRPQRLLLTFLLILGIGLTGCEGPEGPQGDQGPQGEQGPQGPEGLSGEDGNANVTLYLFDGHDFGGTESFTNRCLQLNNQQEFRESAWLYYLVSHSGPSGASEPLYYSIPGFGAFGGEYLVGRSWNGCGVSESRHVINCIAGGCGEYEEIHIIRIEGSNVVDNRSKQAGSIIPDDLDVSDYHAVMDYYGISD